MEVIQIKVPGKLYIAGEYAVVEPGYSAMITTVNLFVHLQIQKSEANYGTFYSEGFTKSTHKWTRKNNCFHFEKKQADLNFVLAAIETTEAYITDLGIPLGFYDLKMTSELNHESNKKLGLGSSGAVTVAIVQGLLTYYQVEQTDLLVFKLAVLAQLKLGINSSFGDLAASSFTGWIHYTSFNRTCIQRKIEKRSTKALVEMPWPYLSIKRIEIAPEIQFLIGWTGSPASSDDLVGNVQSRKEQSTVAYQQFLDTSKKSVTELMNGLIQNNKEKINHAIKKNRQALLKMGRDTDVLIETPHLTKLIEIADKYDGAAKTSGAGGGDSGIAFIFEEQNIPLIVKEWQQSNITYLPLKIYEK